MFNSTLDTSGPASAPQRSLGWARLHAEAVCQKMTGAAIKWESKHDIWMQTTLPVPPCLHMSPPVTKPTLKEVGELKFQRCKTLPPNVPVTCEGLHCAPNPCMTRPVT